MKKTKGRAFTAQELMEHAMANVAYDLIRAKITVQGIHDSVAMALSYILGPDDVEYAVERVKRESGYSIQEAGHA